ncbi:ATP-binding protein [Qaidamihabitans albus]|uniref:ATP-binding protein n=1 Tax=Qaidamihabitans albus TaxID=2795733 RepID=UPI0027DC1019|nr:ATP-binding protein [Qaidamihabitans albus]
MCFDVPARVEQLSALRHALADWAHRRGVAGEQIDAMTLATYEALANVVEHAYPDAEGTLDLRARCLPHSRRVEVTVTDHGHWQPPPADPGPLSGRGLPLMQQLADTAHVEPDPQGTTVRLHWITTAPC